MPCEHTKVAPAEKAVRSFPHLTLYPQKTGSFQPAIGGVCLKLDKLTRLSYTLIVFEPQNTTTPPHMPTSDGLKQVNQQRLQKSIQNPVIANLAPSSARYTAHDVPLLIQQAVIAGREAGKSLRTLAKDTNLSVNTIRAILRQETPPSRMVERMKKGLAGKLYQVADMALDRVVEEGVIERLGGYQAMLVAGIAIDKARLVEGESTQNIDIRLITMKLEELAAEEKRLMAQLNESGVVTIDVNDASESNDIV